MGRNKREKKKAGRWNGVEPGRGGMGIRERDYGVREQENGLVLCGAGERRALRAPRIRGRKESSPTAENSNNAEH